jgi:hypothetical protein
MQTQRQFRVIGQDEPATEATDQAAPNAQGTDVSRNVSTKGSKIALAMLPITPVPFSGTGAIYAWGRLLTYGALSVMLYNKHKTASYVFAGAAGLSLVTSLAAKSWEG